MFPEPYLHHFLLRFAHVESLLHDCLDGHGWILFPGIPVLAFAMLIAYTIERLFEIMPMQLRRSLVFAVLFGFGLGASIGIFGAVSVKALEVTDKDRTQQQMLAFLDAKFCVMHSENSFCRARKYFNL